MRAGIIAASAAAMLSLSASRVEALNTCKETGTVDVTAISQQEYEQVAAEAGRRACVTDAHVTVCQIIPVSTGL